MQQNPIPGPTTAQLSLSWWSSQMDNFSKSNKLEEIDILLQDRNIKLQTDILEYKEAKMKWTKWEKRLKKP